MKPVVQEKKKVEAKGKLKKEEKVKPKIEKKYIQTKGFFGSENVDKVTRGSSSRWDESSGSGKNGGSGGYGQIRRPQVKAQKPSTKEEVLVEAKETERILDELGESFVETDHQLLSHPDLMLV